MNTPPTKLEAFIEALIRRKSMNTFEANRDYGDTCLHSTVSDFQKRHSIKIDRKLERVKSRYGKYVSVTRYRAHDIEKMTRLLNQLRKNRGI